MLFLALALWRIRTVELLAECIDVELRCRIILGEDLRADTHKATTIPKVQWNNYSRLFISNANLVFCNTMGYCSVNGGSLEYLMRQAMIW